MYVIHSVQNFICYAIFITDVFRTSSTTATIPTEAQKISQFVKMRSQFDQNPQTFHTMIKNRNQHCICLRTLIFNHYFGEGNGISTMHFVSM